MFGCCAVNSIMRSAPRCPVSAANRQVRTLNRFSVNKKIFLVSIQEVDIFHKIVMWTDFLQFNFLAAMYTNDVQFRLCTFVRPDPLLISIESTLFSFDLIFTSAYHNAT